MSISRKNWSALSSLARQWTMEDEEEVQRERRRRVKSSTSTADPEPDASPSDVVDKPASTADPEPDASASDVVDKPPSSHSSPRVKSRDVSPGLNSEEQQVDFMEMLRVRDEKRRMRQETLRRQKEEGDEKEPEPSGGEGDEKEPEPSGGGGGGGGGGGSRRGGAIEKPPEDTAKEQDDVFSQQPLRKTTSFRTTLRSSSTSKQQENGESPVKDPDPKPPSRQARKFVSAVAISLDKSPTVSVSSPPMSPSSPAATQSPPGHRRPPPCRSPPAGGTASPVQNREPQKTTVNGSPTNSELDRAPNSPFTRQSSRTVSFRLMQKKEEDSSPMKRSSSVRVVSKKFEQPTDKDTAAPFQRNSKQRASSRSIQEKMERLAQAAQKSEVARYPDVAQRTLFLLDEVSRKRGLFEKESQAESTANPGGSRQEFKGFSSGVSGRIDRWLNKAKQPGSSHSPADLRHVNISSKRSLFENKAETSSGKH